MFTLALTAPLFLGAGATILQATQRSNSPLQSISQDQWSNLNASVGGRLFAGIPFAEPCFSVFDGDDVTSSPQACSVVQNGYFSTSLRSDVFGAYQSPQWETCQSTGQGCTLDSSNPFNTSAFTLPEECNQGSVPSYYIDVNTADDVSAAFKFSAQTGISLVIKNTGHDFLGRSSAPDSLALWTHHLKGNVSYVPSFVPEGCPKHTTPVPGVTYPAGEQWSDMYQFAEDNNITVVGGAQRSVGSGGGFLQGGGHGPLTPSFGLAAERVLEFKIVTPDGKLRVANACQNTDLFFALRGGGGGTFGVVLETTTRALPQLTVQVVYVSLDANETKAAEFLSVLVANTPKWAKEGWGAYILPTSALYLNPNLTKEEAALSIKPIIDFANTQSGTKNITITEEPSFFSFYSNFIDLISGPAGTELAIGSRFLPAVNFATNASQAELVTALGQFIAEVDVFEVLATTPFGAPIFEGASTTEAWRESLWTIDSATVWSSESSPAEVLDGYTRMTKALDGIRAITPGAGAYPNEADLFEPDWQTALYGSNYNKLLAIKNKYDPSGILDCWHCIGWKGASQPLYSCYP